MSSSCNDVILCKGLSEKNESQEEYVKYLKTSGYNCRVLRTLSFEFINLDHLKECLLHPESYSGKFHYLDNVFLKLIIYLPQVLYSLVREQSKR